MGQEGQMRLEPLQCMGLWGNLTYYGQGERGGDTDEETRAAGLKKSKNLLDRRHRKKSNKNDILALLM